MKPRNFRDLLTEEPFTRGDVITLQDPTNLEKFDVSQFHHIKHNITLNEEGMKDTTIVTIHSHQLVHTLCTMHFSVNYNSFQRKRRLARIQLITSGC